VAALADLRLVALRQLLDAVVDERRACGAHGVVEEVRLLRDRRDRVGHARERQLAHVVAVDAHHSFLLVVEARDAADVGGLAAAASWRGRRSWTVLLADSPPPPRRPRVGRRRRLAPRPPHAPPLHVVTCQLMTSIATSELTRMTMFATESLGDVRDDVVDPRD